MEETEKISIDLSKLENLRQNGDGSWDAACPACRAEGSDKTGNHLRVFPSMAFYCAKYNGDKDHNRQILQATGSAGIVLPPVAISEPRIKVEEFFDNECLSRLVSSYDYWTQRGISSSVLRQFEGGVATTGKMKNRYVFPMRDKQGRIHGFTGRYIFPTQQSIPRWKHIGIKENWIFDRQRTVEAIASNRVAILTEGIGCALALREVGIYGVVPIFGVVPSSRLISTLIGLNPKKIFISLNNELDNTRAKLNGNEAAQRAAGILSNFFSEDRIILRLPANKDWMDCDIEERTLFKKEISC